MLEPFEDIHADDRHPELGDQATAFLSRLSYMLTKGSDREAREYG
jgi:hypothetical protein